MNKFQTLALVGLVIFTYSIGRAEDRRPPRHGQEMGPGRGGSEQKEMLAEKIRRDEFHLAMDKLKMKHLATTGEKEKAAVVEEAKKLFSKNLDEERESMQKQLTRMQDRMKEFESHRADSLQNVEKMFSGGGGGGGRGEPQHED